MESNTEPLRGSIDICNENGIAGWAFNPNTPNESVALEIYIDDELITSTIANILRQDLLDAGIGNGKCAFKTTMPNRFTDGNVHKTTIKNQSQEILNSGGGAVSATFQIQDQIRGSVDIFRDGVFSGWAIRNSRLFAQVDMLANDTLVATALATDFRQDLATSNINAGYAAFNLKVPWQLKTQQTTNIKIQVGPHVLYTKQHKFAPIKVLIVSEADDLNDAPRYYRCEHLRLLLNKEQIDTHLISIADFCTKDYLGSQYTTIFNQLIIKINFSIQKYTATLEMLQQHKYNTLFT